MGQTRPLVPHRLPANVTEGWGSAFRAREREREEPHRVEPLRSLTTGCRVVASPFSSSFPTASGGGGPARWGVDSGS